jgi:Pentapeptide repeats (9 copies)
VLVIAGLLVFLVLPGIVIDPSEFSAAKDRVAAENAVRTVGVQLLGGFVLTVGAYFTARTYRLNREGQITDRFSAAIGHLAGEELATQLGGVYALERIMRDSAGDQGPILEILCAFVRTRARDERADDQFPSPEVAAALRVIGRRDVRQDPRGYTLNLSTTNLCAASLRDGNFAKTNFWRTDLRHAYFEKTVLQGAYLRSTNLADATFRKTDLRDANLRNARLERTDLTTSTWDGATYDDDTVWPTGEAPFGTRRVDG